MPDIRGIFVWLGCAQMEMGITYPTVYSGQALSRLIAVGGARGYCSRFRNANGLAAAIQVGKKLDGCDGHDREGYLIWGRRKETQKVGQQGKESWLFCAFVGDEIGLWAAAPVDSRVSRLGLGL